MMNEDSHSLLGDTRGAVMAEGVIVLPVFIILLAAIVYFQRAYSAKLDANLQARNCAWAYSLSGCTGRASLPEGCNIAEIGDGEDAFKAIARDPGIDSKTLKALGRQRDGSVAGNALAGASAIGRALTGLQEGFVARPSRSVPVPSILGGGQRRFSANYSVMCNERNYSATELAHAAYCSLGDQMPGCGDYLQ